MNIHWGGVLISIVLIFGGVLNLLTGSGLGYWGAAAPPWSWLIFLPVGIVVGFWSARGLLRGEGKKPVYTDEDIARAKEKMDRLYLREHGAPPQAPENNLPDADATRTAPPAVSASPPTARPKPAPPPPGTLTPEEEARAAQARRKIRQGLLLMLAGAAVFYVAGGALLLIPAFILLLAGLTRLAVGLVERS